MFNNNFAGIGGAQINSLNGPDGVKVKDNSNQIVLQSTLKESQNGREMLIFSIPLGMIELTCICPIPDEGTTGAPVYVKPRILNGQPAHQVRQFTSKPRSRNPQFDGLPDTDDDSEDDQSR
jgi:hypothetical protein